MDKVDKNEPKSISIKSGEGRVSTIFREHAVVPMAGTRLLTLTEGTALQGYATLLLLPMALSVQANSMSNNQKPTQENLVCLVF